VSYDDITRELVPLPDSSHRPTTAEEKLAYEPRVREQTQHEQDTAAAVRAAFAEDTYLDRSDLDVAVEGSTAVLVGSVVTEADRRRAIEIARGVPGITEVRDELRVRL
jgi:osmotically-inducible protein OsmY